MSLRHINATVEDEEQLEAVINSEKAELCFIDSGFFDADKFSYYVGKAHAHGMKLGLRMPQLWRDTAEGFFKENTERIRKTAFDCYLFRNFEGLLAFKDMGLIGEGMKYMLDHTVYIFNKASVEELTDLIKAADCLKGFSGITLPLELNMHELKGLAENIKAVKITENNAAENISACEDSIKKIAAELIVYGRAPMMASSQCVRKTAAGCDKKTETLYLKDRKGALFAAKNICRFCYGVIYNSVPTAVYDLKNEIRDIAPDSIRYEFTTESGKEVLEILESERPLDGSFTRGHFKKSVE